MYSSFLSWGVKNLRSFLSTPFFFLQRPWIILRALHTGHTDKGDDLIVCKTRVVRRSVLVSNFEHLGTYLPLKVGVILGGSGLLVPMNRETKYQIPQRNATHRTASHRTASHRTARYRETKARTVPYDVGGETLIPVTAQIPRIQYHHVSQYKPHYQYSAQLDGEGVPDVQLNTGNVTYIGK